MNQFGTGGFVAFCKVFLGVLCIVSVFRQWTVCSHSYSLVGFDIFAVIVLRLSLL